MLVQGGIVLSLDPTWAISRPRDVLIEHGEIVAVGPGLQNGEAEVIDASGMIVMPGFVDSHRHIWEGLLRNIGTDVPLEGRSGYISFVLHKLAPAFRPEDAYIGDLISRWERSTPGSRRCSIGRTSRAHRRTPTR